MSTSIEMHNTDLVAIMSAIIFGTRGAEFHYSCVDAVYAAKKILHIVETGKEETDAQ